MKRTLSLLLSLVMALSLAACSGNENSSSSQVSSAAPESSAAESSASESSSEAPSSSEVSSQAQAEDTGSGSSVLVVYYSATGNTAQVAQYIADSTGGDLFEIQPVEPYTDDDLNWTERDVELVADTVDNWDQYDTAFIGYPIWWGITAWPVDGFVEANDFSGKTVIPFCTSSSSGLGQSGQLLADMAGTGDWQEGQRFRSGASQEDVQSWIEELGL